MLTRIRGAVGLLLLAGVLSLSVTGPALADSHGKKSGGRQENRGGGGRGGGGDRGGQLNHRDGSQNNRGQGERWQGSSGRQEQRRDDRGRGNDNRNYRGYRGGSQGHGGGHSDIWPFLGGVVVGAVIGSHHDAPVYRPHSVVFVYHCDWCDYRGVSYGNFCDHLVCEHRIPRCDVGGWFHPNEHGSWEDSY